MPTIIFIWGWQFYFFPNEGNEPIHIHARKAEKTCKYWLDIEKQEITEDYTFSMTPSDKRKVKAVILENFEYIVEQWNK
ncbi:MAG: DUF4160 domain-containing protein, partial [bacterium]